jgi:hypothetical protein
MHALEQLLHPADDEPSYAPAGYARWRSDRGIAYKIPRTVSGDEEQIPKPTNRAIGIVHPIAGAG